MEKDKAILRRAQATNRRTIDNDATKAPWRNTALDNWSRDVDPAIMSGDQYVDNDHDLGTTRRENLELQNGTWSPVAAPFMHPTHDASMRNGEDE
ncbi:hypothetical protein CIG75_05745 [Tumebacillus algifaecis]|uniref:Uncharacterized protein n=1 Tax=Tumebacillus algifaecis TaxID=1214604 RepID=A0A223D6K5_9BACL|nr:DUF3905 domain-containing protein [Tumebacillus algifaecis]ASS77130.1 hypothetical protein CIG75_05745 [Tumebacillus algifaecis]